MLVECTQCRARVNAEELSEFIGFDNEVEFDVRYAFLKCPSCQNPLLTYQWRPEEGRPWDSPKRLYPPVRRLSFQIPSELRRSFRESIGCQESGHYLATALMCRRTLEGICIHYLGSVQNLAAGLRKLHEKGIVDDRLLEWAEALRNDGNLAAHDFNVRITPEDAEDLVDFTEAILDYVFVLRDRFEEYKNRRERRSKKDSGKVPPSTGSPKT
jgi:Domain of unknown function (DUF4145)